MVPNEIMLSGEILNDSMLNISYKIYNIICNNNMLNYRLIKFQNKIKVSVRG